MAPTWASLPKDASGKSVYGNQTAKPLEKVLGYMQSNEKARAGINDGYQKLNETNASKPSAEVDAKVKTYWNEITKIDSKKPLLLKKIKKNNK
jgi:predicted rRNA methylase YqxC with S4 and FtsJ domains